jgi:bifunctional DNA-binding transcriptional regulator/antitoxin component of YhaV-PrlF toxin-antitoxin module
MRAKVKRAKGTTRVSRKNQVTIPVAALAKARVRAGDELRVTVEAKGRILLARDHDPLDNFVGALAGLSAATDLEKLREEWDQ